VTLQQGYQITTAAHQYQVPTGSDINQAGRAWRTQTFFTLAVSTFQTFFSVCSEDSDHWLVLQLLRIVRENAVVIVVGETGSGKTTQLTQVCCALRLMSTVGYNCCSCYLLLR